MHRGRRFVRRPQCQLVYCAEHALPLHLLDTVKAPVLIVRQSHDGFSVDGPATFRAGWRPGDDGVFARWRWNGSRLDIERDRWGVQPLFWSLTATSVHLSPSIQALLDAGVPADLDDAAMAVFLRTGFFVGDDTPFAAIRALPSAASIAWTPQGVTLDGHWRYPRASTFDRAAAIQRFAECFTATVERRLRTAVDPIAVPLSGGRDSRHILLAMHELRALPDRCVTVHPYPPAAADDVAIAGQVAAAIGVRHVVLPQRPRRVAAEHEKNVLTHYCADEHAQFLPLRDYFAAHRCEVFDGLAGDVLTQSQRLDPALHADFVEGRFERVAQRVLGDEEKIEPALARLLTRRGAERFPRQLAVARVAAEAAHHAGAPNPIAGSFFFSRMRREVALAPYALLDICPVSTPFLDAELVDLLFSLPFALAADRTLHTETLQRRYPAFAHLPFDTKRKGTENRWLTRRAAAELLALAFACSSKTIGTSAIAARALRALATGASPHLWFLPRMVQLFDVERRYTEFTR
jgi:asparagine synthase (glutamine-hydrolysing)